MTSNSEVSCLPECWNDDERMTSMFLEFRNKTVNPTAWQSKITFWIDCINNFCCEKNKIMFDICDLEHAFLRKNRVPSVLDAVITQMRRYVIS